MPNHRSKPVLTIGGIVVDRKSFTRMFTPSGGGLPAETWYDLLAGHHPRMPSKRRISVNLPRKLVDAPDTLYIEGAPITRQDVFASFPPATDKDDQRRRDLMWNAFALVIEERRRQKYEPELVAGTATLAQAPRTKFSTARANASKPLKLQKAPVPSRVTATPAEFRRKHRLLAPSSPRASYDLLIRLALVKPSLDVLLDAAVAFGLPRVEGVWAQLRQSAAPEVARAKPHTQRILNNLRRGWDQVGMGDSGKA